MIFQYWRLVPVVHQTTQTKSDKPLDNNFLLSSNNCHLSEHICTYLIHTLYAYLCLYYVLLFTYASSTYEICKYHCCGIYLWSSKWKLRAIQESKKKENAKQNLRMLPGCIYDVALLDSNIVVVVFPCIMISNFFHETTNN